LTALIAEKHLGPKGVATALKNVEVARQFARQDISGYVSQLRDVYQVRDNITEFSSENGYKIGAFELDFTDQPVKLNFDTALSIRKPSTTQSPIVSYDLTRAQRPSPKHKSLAKWRLIFTPEKFTP
jgi:hypothetical protein